MNQYLNANQKRYLTYRRCVEMVFVMVAIIFAVPIMVTIGLCVAIDSRGGIIFRQQRIGRHGRWFTLYKFRSMYLPKYSYPFQLAVENDQRITKVGKWIRKHHLDELPQFFNVLMGDMSIIGPRPVPVEVYNKYRSKISHYDVRHIVRPGITGFSQICQGYTNQVEEERIKLQGDIAYLTRISARADLRIMFATVIKFMTLNKYKRKIRVRKILGVFNNNGIVETKQKIDSDVNRQKKVAIETYISSAVEN